MNEKGKKLPPGFAATASKAAGAPSGSESSSGGDAANASTATTTPMVKTSRSSIQSDAKPATLVVSGSTPSAGSTTVTAGLAAALRLVS